MPWIKPWAAKTATAFPPWRPRWWTTWRRNRLTCRSSVNSSMKENETARAARDARRRGADDGKGMMRWGRGSRSSVSGAIRGARCGARAGGMSTSSRPAARSNRTGSSSVGGVYVVETKGWSGRLTGDGAQSDCLPRTGHRRGTWPIRYRSVRRKARLLANLLQQELGARGSFRSKGWSCRRGRDLNLGADRSCVLLPKELIQRAEGETDTCQRWSQSGGEDGISQDTVRQVTVRHVFDALAGGGSTARDDLLHGVRSLVRDLREKARLPEVRGVVWIIWVGSCERSKSGGCWTVTGSKRPEAKL